MSDTQKINVTDQIVSLVKKAEQSEKSDDALKFSQAACNAANAACAGNIANAMVHPKSDG